MKLESSRLHLHIMVGRSMPHVRILKRRISEARSCIGFLFPQPKGKSEIYIFYQLFDEEQKFFWFRLPDKREWVAKAIAKSLELYRIL